MAAAGQGQETPMTTIHIPTHMMRVANVAFREVGGLLFFKKNPNNTLELDIATFASGTTEHINFSLIFAHNEDEPFWFLFHTHPQGEIGYLGLSGTDLYLMFRIAMLRRPDTMAHLLFTPTHAHCTLVSRTYNNVITMLNEYNADCRSRGESDCLDDFMRGMKTLCDIAGDYCALAAQKEDGSFDDAIAMSKLNTIRFLPHDVNTFEMCEIVTSLSDKYQTILESNNFLKWFRTDTTAERLSAVIPIMGEGLFYSWTADTSQKFLDPVSGDLTFRLDDNAELYKYSPDLPSPDFDFGLNSKILNKFPPSSSRYGGGKKKKRTLRKRNHKRKSKTLKFAY